jgi:hypothetical protein
VFTSLDQGRAGDFEAVRSGRLASFNYQATCRQGF